jgi:ribosomal protein L7/L12
MAVKKSAKKPVKSSTGKKPAGKTKSGGKSGRDGLLKQLSAIAGELNEEGLAFLVKQALVLRHNMQVDEIRENLGKAAASPKSARGKTAAEKPARKGADKRSVDIVEGENGRNFILVINNYRNFFSLEEMRKIVAMCHAASDAKDASSRLYGWFRRERMDMINNSGIDGPGDVALATIYQAIVSKYTVRG